MVQLLLVVLAVALWLAWSARRRAAAAQDDLFELRFQTGERFAEVAQEMEALRRQVAVLQSELRRQAGGRFTGDLTVSETLARHPGAGQVLSAFGIAGCGMAEDTLARAAEKRERDLQQLLGALNALLDSNVAPPAPTRRLIQIQ